MYDDVSLKTKLRQTKLNHLGSYSEPFLGHKTRLHLYLFYRYRVFSRLYSLIYALFSVDWTCRIPSTIIINSRERTERPGLRDENVRPRRTFITATINDAARRWNESPQNDSATQYSDCTKANQSVLVCFRATVAETMTLPARWRPPLTFLHGRRCVRRLTVTWSYQERVERLVTGLSLLPHPALGIGCRPTWNSCVRLLHSRANWRVFCFVLLTPGTLCELWNTPSVWL